MVLAVRTSVICKDRAPRCAAVCLHVRVLFRNQQLRDRSVYRGTVNSRKYFHSNTGNDATCERMRQINTHDTRLRNLYKRKLAQ